MNVDRCVDRAALYTLLRTIITECIIITSVLYTLPYNVSDTMWLYMHIFMFHVLNPHSLSKTFLMLILVSFWLYTLLNDFKNQAEQLGLYMYKTFYVSFQPAR